MDLTLSNAALNGQLDEVIRTIPFLINPISSRVGDKERTALHCACMDGHYNVVNLLLAKGADVNMQDQDGNTPAHLCIKAQTDVKILALLLEHGTTISIVNNDRLNLLHLAAQCGRPAALALPLSKDPTAEYRHRRAGNGDTLVLCALTSNHRSLETIKLAGNAISIPECLASNEAGKTGLHLATKLNDVECMNYFLDKGNLNERTSNGSTALHLAFTDGDAESAKLLLCRGADIFITTNDGNTPLHLAALNHSSRIDAILLAEGMETTINQKNRNSCTAIHTVMNQLCYTSDTFHVMNKLLSIPVIDINATDGDDRTPLIKLAMSMGRYTSHESETYDLIKLLLNKDVDVDKRDKSGSTTLHHLCEREGTEMVASTIELLLVKGIDDLVRNKKGLLAVELMLRSIERCGESQVIGDFRRKTLGNLLKRIPDDKFNALYHGWTRPFVLALKYGAKALASELAPRTLDVDRSYAEYRSAFCPLDACCVYDCDFSIFETLASRSKDLSKKNVDGDTLLHLACLYNKGAILKYLLGQIVDVDVEDDTGSTALNLALEYGMWR